MCNCQKGTLPIFSFNSAGENFPSGKTFQLPRVVVSFCFVCRSPPPNVGRKEKFFPIKVANKLQPFLAFSSAFGLFLAIFGPIPVSVLCHKNCSMVRSKKFSQLASNFDLDLIFCPDFFLGKNLKASHLPSQVTIVKRWSARTTGGKVESDSAQ